MPADLDEMFTSLGRQADSLPIGTAGQARDRGRQRNRRRAIFSAAAAVMLAAVGVGVALRPSDHRAIPPITGRVDNNTIPTVGSPIDLGGDINFGRLATGDGRAYTAWLKEADSSLWLTAADLRTGAQSWATRQIVDPHRMLDRVIAVPSAVLVVTRGDDEPERGLFAFDPETGSPLWQSEASDADSLIYADRMLVRLGGQTGLTEGLDWVTGKRRWSVAAAASDRPVRAVGMAVPADEKYVNQSEYGAESSVRFSGDRFVSITQGGAAQVRDVVSGTLRRTVPGIPDSSEAMVAYDGWLYSHDRSTDGPQHVRLTDLAGDAGTRAVPVTAGEFVTLGACGPGRVCVITTAASSAATVTAVDVREHRVAWRARSTWRGDVISSAQGWTLLTSTMGGTELFDPNGRQVYTSQLLAAWFDTQTLLVIATDGTGVPAKLSLPRGQVTKIGGSVADLNGLCIADGERLACTHSRSLTIRQVR